jgi:hypothetical protein
MIGRAAILMLAAWFLSSPPAFAVGLHFASGRARTTMIELFTSEGCSSCPPAEAYLSDFQRDPQLWTKYIPLAFHVGYWDYLGWRDRFADPANVARQRRYARERAMPAIYTPAFFVNGKPWWRASHPDVPRSSAPAGSLTVDVTGNRYRAVFAPAGDIPKRLQLNVALLGMGLHSDIRAGENAGRHETHDFVVLGWQRFDSDSRHWQGTLPSSFAARGAARLALAAWVSRPGDPTPLQATGGYLSAGAASRTR